jgi:hypothetical protein
MPKGRVGIYSVGYLKKSTLAGFFKLPTLALTPFIISKLYSYE